MAENTNIDNWTHEKLVTRYKELLTTNQVSIARTQSLARFFLLKTFAAICG